MNKFYENSEFLALLHKRLNEPRKTIQIIFGPRQVGKTTLVRQLLTSISTPFHYASADLPMLKDQTWLYQQWDIARLKAGNEEGLLILDEIQKIPNWSEAIKKYWDEDTFTGKDLKVILLGSAPLLIQQGLTESLAGRFEIISLTHWDFPKMRDTFGFSLDQYIYFGGYPGAAHLIDDEDRFRAYINDSLIETSISRDILLLTRVDKPALLRQLFELGTIYSSQILSFQKMLGQLSDAGNATTLAHYLELLSGAGLITGLSKFTQSPVQQRNSSPKLQVLNTSLITASQITTFAEYRNNLPAWGRLVESAVGATLINQARLNNMQVFYWREGNFEVDYVLKRGKKYIAIEVKSGTKPANTSGIQAFNKKFSPYRNIIIGADGLSLDDFFTSSFINWFD